jgi:hypothetical protein
MKTIAATIKAWLPGHAGPDDLTGTPEQAVSTLAYYDHDMTSSGWTYAGMATITVEIVDSQALVDNKVAALREELKAAQVEAAMKIGDIELKIQKLLAIEYVPEATE